MCKYVGISNQRKSQGFIKQVFELINFQTQNPREDSLSPPSEQTIKLTPSQLIRHHNRVPKPES
jgi:hypothetical protein